MGKRGCKPATNEARFWSKVDKSGGPDACWPWMAAISSSGYGNFAIRDGDADYRYVPASRAAYELTHGPLEGRAVVMHSCDNRPCCNPAHLSAGTYKDNQQDSIRKGRHCVCTIGMPGSKKRRDTNQQRNGASNNGKGTSVDSRRGNRAEQAGRREG